MSFSLEEQDFENRKRELNVLNALVDYLSNRDDNKDPNPGFKKFEDYGFIEDLIVVLLPLNSRILAELRGIEVLDAFISGYLADNCELELGELSNYDNKRCVFNLKQIQHEKNEQLVTTG